MIDLAVLAGVAVIVSSVVVVFGCVCHLFKRGPAFTTFENDPEGGYGNTVFSSSDTSEISQVTFETIPDILAKTVTATALRPRISCINGEIQKQSAKRVASYKAFPRSHLTYIKEMGVGWFGQVLVSEAYNMVTSSRSTRVVVKMMKDDANSTEQQLFLQDLSVYRELDHSNVLKLLGQCTEAPPLLAIMEFASMGDLKSYLRKECQIVKNMKNGTIRMQFLTDMAAGLECLHSNGYLHHDFACRNCMVMSNMTVKIGDYGVAEDHFREDYYDSGQDLIPIRWMSPETIALSNSIWQITRYTEESNIWSFGIAMYEVTEYGQQPYHDMTDEQVLQNMIAAYPTKLRLPHTDDRIKSKLYQIMETCWVERSQRPSIEEMHSLLRQIQAEKDAADEAEFERKWAKISSKEARVVKVEVHASDVGTGLKHNVIDSTNLASKTKNDGTSDFNSNSVPLSNQESRQRDKVLTGVSSSDNLFNNESLEIVSGRIVEQPALPNLLSDISSVINTPTKDRPLVHQFTSTPVLKNKDLISSAESATNLNSVLNVQKSQSVKMLDSKIESSESKHDFDVVKNRLDEKSKDECVQNLSRDDNIPDLPVNIEKVQTINEERTELKTNSHNIDTNFKDLESIKTSDVERNTKPLDNVDSFIDFEDCDNKLRGQISGSDHDSKKKVDIEIRIEEVEPSGTRDDRSESISEESDNEEEEAEKLKQLKLTLTGVLSTGVKTTSNENGDTHDGISSPTSDDMDIAREIYMSKGMSMPPSKYTSTRSLNTILEDELSENEPQPEVKTASTELKFVEPLEDFNVSDSYQDSFEWDDYIGDELIGRVKNSEVSPRQSIDIDWTMEHDSSSQDSEIQNGSRNDTSLNTDKKSSAISTPCSSSDSEVKSFRSPIGAAVHSKSPKSPLGAAAHNYVKHILSNRISNNSTNKGVSFYSFSHNIDMDNSEHAESSSSSFNTASQYNLLDEWDL